MVMGTPSKTLLPGGVDVCAKVFGRVFDQYGNNITSSVAVAVEWTDGYLLVGTPDKPINPDGTYEFCLSRGKFNIFVVAEDRSSEKYWFSTDEPNFTGQVVYEINFQLVR
jgi:hypothetical protein